MAFERALTLEELAPGQHRKVFLAETPILVANLGGEIHAVNDLCLHKGGSLASGEMVGPLVTCPLHFWTFDVRDGVCTQVPSLQLKRYAVKIEEGVIYLEV